MHPEIMIALVLIIEHRKQDEKNDEPHTDHQRLLVHDVVSADEMHESINVEFHFLIDFSEVSLDLFLIFYDGIE